MEPFASVPEQPEAKRLLGAALSEGPAHAYLMHGPAGVGKRTAAFAFAAALLGDERRVLARTHPDLYLLEPLGEMIRIDEVRALRHDLHMRPFEAERRVYLVLDAQRMNEEAADALLKDLEEPPPYAVIVLVASELGPLPPTILSRCQL
ncbi:MAG: DNA polymerase III subunit delta', partial [Gaiellaceae bacterium]